MIYFHKYYYFNHNNIGDYMKKVPKTNITLIFFILIFFISSILTIYSASTYVEKGLIFKQVLWYLIGTVIIVIISKIKNKYIYDNNKLFYCINIILLSLLLIFAPEINGSKCWFVIPKIGNFQPSEFMKIFLIITLATIVDDFNNHSYNILKDEIKFILKAFIITLIPSILTFLEPDTGVVIIYFIIMICMLFTSKLRLRWFIILIAILIVSLSVIFYLYFFNKELFINIFSTQLFYRLERVLSWTNNTSYQLDNALISIGNTSLLPEGIKYIPLYYRYPATHFIFASFTSSFGYIFSIILLIIIFLFDHTIIKIILHSNGVNKYVAIGSISMLLYQQIQNIGMNIGILPITGITLPFISYGGSSLLSYMFLIGLILNINKQNEKQL